MYIAIEGLDFAGKSTQANLLVAWLRSKGRNAHYLRHPGQTPLGAEIRKLVKNKELPAEPMAQFMMFMADCANSMPFIQSMLDLGGDIVADRCWYSSYVYQGFGLGIDLSFIRYVSLRVCWREPHHVCLLQLSAEKRKRRCQQTRQADTAIAADRYESREDAFQRKLEHGYRSLPLNFKNIWTFDADRSINEVQCAIRKQLAIEYPDLRNP